MLKRNKGIRQKFLKLVELFPDCPIYIWGESVRNLISGTDSDKIDIFIKTTKRKNAETIVENNKTWLSMFNISYGTNIEFSQKRFTIDCLYISLRDILEADADHVPEIHYKNEKVARDFKKNVIKFANKFEDKLETNKLLILEAVYVCCQTGFHMDLKTTRNLFKVKGLATEITPRILYSFLKLSFKNAYKGKARGFISTMNTIGLSQEIFGVKLKEHAILNHLNKKDTLEFLAFILSDVENLEDTLITKLGIIDDDRDAIINTVKMLKMDFFDDSDENARNIVKLVGKKRILNIIRLIKNMGHKELGNKIKGLKNIPLTFDDLKIQFKDIQEEFGYNDEITQSLLETALKWVVETPELNTKLYLLHRLGKVKGNMP